LSRYGLAARHLGQFNGAFLAGQPLPAWSWLSGGNQTRDYVDLLLAPLDQLQDALSQWQALHGVSAALAGRFLRLYEERALYLDALDRLPQTLCHGDADRRNFLSRASGGREETVAIDWAFAGLDVPGTEIHRLITNAVLFFQIDPTQLPALEEMVFASYVSGLGDAGWRVDSRMVRLGYAASSALAEGLVVVGAGLVRFIDPSWHQMYEQFSGSPIEEIIARTLFVLSYQLDLADEARALLAVL
jgi:hypothetical protein